MYFWKGFVIVCSSCGHRNRPSKSPREGVRLVLTGQLKPCRGCGKRINPRLSNRPLIRRIREELAAEGVQTFC